MKVAIYSPYLDTFGGGEKYIATLAESLSKDNEVDLLLDKHLKDIGGDELKLNLEKRFNLNLENVDTIAAPVGKGSHFTSRIFFLKNYDLLFYLTDGSIFYPTSKKNILHIQSPLAGQPAKSLWGKFKLKKWDVIIYNSNFTKIHSEKNWPISSIVIYPPVDVYRIKPQNKKKYILSVGRFFGYLRDKKHAVLIESFRRLVKVKRVSGWTLNLVGSASDGDKVYIDELKKNSSGLPINFYPNLGYDELVNLYGQSSIYWHASGYQEDNPAKMEHFGISTVEAMAGGCVPVVIKKGGQSEIVKNGKSGFLWDNLDELINFSLKLINDEKLMTTVSNKAIERAKLFGKDKFIEKINKLLNIIS